MTSAMLAPDSLAIGSRAARTLFKRAGSLPSQLRAGSKRIRDPFAPPRRSEPRKVRALSQAVATNSETVSPIASIFALTAATS